MDRNPSELLTVKEICAERKISPNTFYRLRKTGHIPEGVPVGLRGIRWRRDVIDASFGAIERRAA